jgi:hypothetical protein
MKGWAKNRDMVTLAYNDQRLLDHLANGGNYGVCTDKDRFVLAADSALVAEVIKSKLPATFAVLSPRHKLPHFYFYGHISRHVQFKPTEEGDPCCDLKRGNAFVVGAGSVYEDYGTYEIIDDLPIATVTEQQVLEALEPFIEARKVEVEASETQVKRPELNFPISALLDLDEFEESGEEIYGAHPVHGSTTGSNFRVNLNKDIWYCFRHCAGGGPLELLAVLQGVISCEDAGKGALRGRKFLEVVNVAVKKGLLKGSVALKSLRKEQERTWQLGEYFLERKKDKAFLFDKNREATTSINIKSVDSAHFKKKLKELSGLDDTTVEKLVANFLLSSPQDNAEEEEEVEAEEEKFSEETQRKAVELLRDPAFLYKLGFPFYRGFVVPRINKPRFVLGEERNKRIIGPLIIGGSRLGMTTIIQVLGAPGTSKDSMVRMWLQMLPLEVRERSYLTAAGLRYSREMQAAEVLYSPDSPEIRGESGRQMRFMRADDGGLISEVAVRDAETGEMTTQTYTLPVKCVVTTSNAVTVDSALESGQWTLYTNADARLTRLVKAAILKLRAGKRPLFPEGELEVWRCAFHILLTEESSEKVPEIPFAENLLPILGSERSESRRDANKLCDLISLIAWLRRFQKPEEKRGSADLIDLMYALELGFDAIKETISELGVKDSTIYQAVSTQGPNATVRMITDATHYAYSTCYSYLRRLVEKGYVVPDKEKGKNVYSVSALKPKTLFNPSNTKDSEPEDQILVILRQFYNSSTRNQISEAISFDGLEFTDPLTGEHVTIHVLGEQPKTLSVERAQEKSDTVIPLYELTKADFEEDIEESPVKTRKTSESPVQREIKRESAELYYCSKCGAIINKENFERGGLCQTCDMKKNLESALKKSNVSNVWKKEEPKNVSNKQNNPSPKISQDGEYVEGMCGQCGKKALVSHGLCRECEKGESDGQTN